MRRINRRKCASISSFLAAASIAGWIGTSPARGDFLVQMTNPEAGDPLQNNPDTANLASAYTGPVQDFVLSAENDGLNGTGDALDAVDIRITISGSGTQNALIFDLDKPGPTSKYFLNASGFSDPNTVGFGDPQGGTYVGIGNAPLTAGYDPNPNNANPSDAIVVDGANDSSGLIFANSTNYLIDDSPHSSVISSNNQSTAGIDPNFLNGVVHAFDMTTFISGGGVPDGPSVGYLPFANIVVPAGVNGSVYIELGGNTGPAQGYLLSFNGSPAGAHLSLTADPISSDQYIGQFNVGSSPLTLSVPAGQAQSTGSCNLTFGQNISEEVIGLDGTGLAGLASTFASGLAPGDGEVVTVSVANLGQSLYDLLNAQGDQLAVIFTLPEYDGESKYFSWDTGNTTATISSITVVTVVPEPTGITALALGGIGLLRGRKQRRRG